MFLPCQPQHLYNFNDNQTSVSTFFDVTFHTRLIPIDLLIDLNSNSISCPCTSRNGGGTIDNDKVMLASSGTSGLDVESNAANKGVTDTADDTNGFSDHDNRLDDDHIGDTNDASDTDTLAKSGGVLPPPPTKRRMRECEEFSKRNRESGDGEPASPSLSPVPTLPPPSGFRTSVMVRGAGSADDAASDDAEEDANSALIRDLKVWML